MLVLCRRIGEEIVIADNIRVRLVAVNGKRARLGITAPPSVPIVREELVSPCTNGKLGAKDCSRKANSAGHCPTMTEKQLASYEEFDRELEGKTAEEVITIVGSPDNVTHMPDGDEVWFYKDRTLNPLTLKPDSPQVIISDGHVKRINHW